MTGLEMRGELLGLGSMVRLSDVDTCGLFVILARGAYRPESDQAGVIARYLVAPHPYGEAPDQETFPIMAGEIEEIVFEGYSDEADAEFLEDLLDQMQHGRRTITPAAQFTAELTHIPVISQQGETAGSGAPHSDVADVFGVLRRLVNLEQR